MLAIQGWAWVIVAVAVLLGVAILSVIARLLKLWVQAHFAGARVTMFDLIGMTLRKVDPRVIVLSKIRADVVGLDVSVTQMQEHYLAGGHVAEVITAMVAAKRANIELTWKTATAMDLAGRDVLGLAQSACQGDSGPLKSLIRQLGEPPEPE